MRAAIVLIPFVLIRFGLLALVNKKAVKKAAHFAPLSEKERPFYWIYQLSNTGIFIYLFFLNSAINQSLFFYTGVIVIVLGLIILTVSIVSFALPCESGINQKGIYHLSRNPMYVSYFVYFIGCALLTKSFVLFGLTIIFQISTHWIILSEERWCLETFGEKYTQYMKEVKRYV